MLEPFTRHSLVGDFSEFGVRERPRRCCPAPVLLDHHLTLHTLLFVAIDRAVHLVGAWLLKGHREHAALSGVQGLLQFGLAFFTPFALDALALDLQGVLGGALVLGLELVGAGFAQGDTRGGKLELGLFDDDSLERSARGGVVRRGRGRRRRGVPSSVAIPSSRRPAGGCLARAGGSAARCPAGTTRTSAAARKHES